LQSLAHPFRHFILSTRESVYISFPRGTVKDAKSDQSLIGARFGTVTV